MPESYALTVVNNSEMQRPTFAVFAVLPALTAYETLATAWLLQPINQGNTYEFVWKIEWGFSWSASGTKQGYKWSGSGQRAASPTDDQRCSVDFGYNGDFYFADAERDHDGQHLWIADLSNLPLTSEKPSSVGVTLSGQPASVTNAGPNLEQTFTLHPTYYISAGNYVAGQMVDGSSVTKFQELRYEGTNRDLTAILNKNNTWTVEKSSQINFEEMFSALAS